MKRAFAAALLGALISALLTSCGGAFEGDDDGDAGSAGSAGSSAGNVGRGGATSGGTDGTAGMTAGSGPSGGMPGVGGSPPDLCSLPPESGNCNAYFPSFFHNAATGVCEPFVYGGCGGNENRFDSVEACQAACSGGAPNLDGCMSPLECVLVTPHCCAPCDGTLQDYTAVNVAAEEAFHAGRECGPIACEPCPQPDPTTANRPYLTATCRNGECVPVDVREEGVADCELPADCSVRAGVGCCEDCGGSETELVAVGGGAALAELVCGDNAPPCLACLPVYPPGYGATCDGGRCALTYTP